jgi:hypothetical protein
MRERETRTRSYEARAESEPMESRRIYKYRERGEIEKEI